MAPSLQGFFETVITFLVSDTVLCPACYCGVATGPDDFRELSPIPVCGLFMSWTLVGFSPLPV